MGCDLSDAPLAQSLARAGQQRAHEVDAGGAALLVEMLGDLEVALEVQNLAARVHRQLGIERGVPITAGKPSIP